jgi:hypothetical protein
MTDAATILERIEAMGYDVIVETDRGGVTIRAVRPGMPDRFTARDSEGDEYEAACQLAKLVLRERREAD